MPNRSPLQRERLSRRPARHGEDDDTADPTPQPIGQDWSYRGWACRITFTPGETRPYRAVAFAPQTHEAHPTGLTWDTEERARQDAEHFVDVKEREKQPMPPMAPGDVCGPGLTVAANEVWADLDTPE